MYVRDQPSIMAPDSSSDLPDSLRAVLDQHEPETLAAIRDHCDRALEEHDIEEEVEERTYG